MPGLIAPAPLLRARNLPTKRWVPSLSPSFLLHFHKFSFFIEYYTFVGRSSKGSVAESAAIAQAVAEVRSVLRSILSDPAVSKLKKSGLSSQGRIQVPSLEKKNVHVYLIALIMLTVEPACMQMIDKLMSESHNSFVACFHVFYPTASLKWSIICELLDYVNKVLDQSCTLLIACTNTCLISFN